MKKAMTEKKKEKNEYVRNKRRKDWWSEMIHIQSNLDSQRNRMQRFFSFLYE